MFWLYSSPSLLLKYDWIKAVIDEVPTSQPSVSPTEVSSTFPTSSSGCSDRIDEWTIGNYTINWCTWAANGDIDARCTKQDLYTDCPVTCDSCVVASSASPSTASYTSPTVVGTSASPSISSPSSPSIEIPSAPPTISPTKEFSVVPSTFPTPVSGPGPGPGPASRGCSDRTGEWTIGTKTKDWCLWARSKGEENTDSRCALKDIYNDCPVTCDSCDCYDRTGEWTIQTKTKDWCLWARSKGEENTDSRCALKDIYNDCPVTCNSCPSTSPTSVLI